MDDTANQEPGNIDDNLTRDALDLFPGVIAGVLGPGVAFHGLRVDNQGAGFRVAPVVLRTSRHRESCICSQQPLSIQRR